MSVENKEAQKKFEIDCSLLINDSLLSIAELKDYFVTKMKIEGKTGNLDNKVSISNTADSLIVEPHVDLSKRYLKYLSKRFLHNKELRDWVRVISNGKSSYKLTYYNVDQAKNE